MMPSPIARPTARVPRPPALAGTGDPRWRALLARDRRADGSFVYAVTTTGVYCRPSCGSRRPRLEHVRFFDTGAAAAAGGFRPCRRCRPDRDADPRSHAVLVAAICRAIERSEAMPSLALLARRAGLSPHHFHRVFKRVTGLTPRAYAAAHRNRRVREDLERSGKSVTQALYDAGFGSSGRFYEASNGVLGMTPSDFREGGTNAEIRFAVGECSLGSILIAQSDRGICAIALGDDPEALVKDLQDRFPRARLLGGDGRFERTVARVVALVEAPGIGLDLPLDVRGTAFQERVWRALRAIPSGRTVTYSELASMIGAPGGARAVARACAANPLALAIPCHRVVRTDGSLSGYRWGIERKRRLLDREREGGGDEG